MASFLWKNNDQNSNQMFNGKEIEKENQFLVSKVLKNKFLKEETVLFLSVSPP